MLNNANIFHRDANTFMHSVSIVAEGTASVALRDRELMFKGQALPLEETGSATGKDRDKVFQQSIIIRKSYGHLLKNIVGPV